MAAAKHPTGIAFLLSQLGQLATERFAARLTELQLLPAQAGILRLIANQPGCSQQALAEQLGLFPSRMVAFIDDLDKRGLVQRRRGATDRRVYELQLTKHGQAVMGQLAAIGKAHEAEFSAGLSAAQRSTLAELLELLASGHGLTAGIHPGYRGS